LLSEGQVTVEAPIVTFPTGQHLLDWVAEVRTAIHPHEVSQSGHCLCLQHAV